MRIGDEEISRRLGWSLHSPAKAQLALHQRFGKPILITEFGTDTVAGSHSQPEEMWTGE